MENGTVPAGEHLFSQPILHESAAVNRTDNE